MKVDSKLTNTTALAYMGDAVYEVYIRKYVLEHGGVRVDHNNRLAISFVRADAQAKAVRRLMEGFLTEEETRLVKRARNHTQTSKPRGSTPIDYKLATGYEALIGYLYLAGKEERLHQVVEETIRAIEQEKETSGTQQHR